MRDAPAHRHPHRSSPPRTVSPAGRNRPQNSPITPDPFAGRKCELRVRKSQRQLTGRRADGRATTSATVGTTSAGRFALYQPRYSSSQPHAADPHVPLLVERLGLRAEVEPPAVRLESQLDGRDGEVDASDEATTAVEDLVLRHHRGEPWVAPGTRPRAPRTNCRAPDPRTGSHRGAAAARRCHADPAGGGAPPCPAARSRLAPRRRASVSARPTSRRSRTTDPRSASVRARLVVGMPSTSTDDRTVEGDDVVRHRSQATEPARRPTMRAVDAHLDRRRVAETVEPVQTSSRTVRRRAVTARRQRRRPSAHARTCAGAPLIASTPGYGSSSQPCASAVATRCAVEFEVGSLASGEHAVLRGCELGDSVNRAGRRHLTDRTPGVRQTAADHPKCEPHRSKSTGGLTVRGDGGLESHPKCEPVQVEIDRWAHTSGWRGRGQ